jgi:DNA replication protein DnaC
MARTKIKLVAPSEAHPDYEALKLARQATQYALDIIRRLVADWPGIVVVIDGNYGTAKTHMLAQLYGAALDAGHTAIYATATAIETRLTDFKGEADGTPYQRERELRTVDVLLIDEATRHTHGRKAAQSDDSNSYFEQKYLDIISERLGAQRLTVLACNQGRTELHPAIRSRASAGVWIDLSGMTDMRPYFGRTWTP